MEHFQAKSCQTSFQNTWVLGYISECLIKTDNGFKNCAATFCKKRPLTLNIKFKSSSARIYEGFELIDDETDYWVFIKFLTNFLVLLFENCESHGIQ